MSRVYGWKRELPDLRDKLHVSNRGGAALPEHVDHRQWQAPVWDQGSLGACTAFAICGAFAFERICIASYLPTEFSTLHLYYCERELEGTVAIDAGAYIRDGMKVAAQMGLAPAEAWPYAPERFQQRPPKSAYRLALDNRITSYARVRATLPGIKDALAGGDTVVGGLSLYESFESYVVASTGQVPMPAHSEQMLGGHAVLFVGYDDRTRRFIVRNSWGAGWGDKGYFYLPYEYIEAGLGADFWVLKNVTKPKETP